MLTVYVWDLAVVSKGWFQLRWSRFHLSRQVVVTQQQFEVPTYTEGFTVPVKEAMPSPTRRQSHLGDVRDSIYVCTNDLKQDFGQQAR